MKLSEIIPVAETPPGVYATRRRGVDGRSWLFLMHEGTGNVEFDLPTGAFRNAVDDSDVGGRIKLGDWGVTVLEEIGS